MGTINCGCGSRVAFGTGDFFVICFCGRRHVVDDARSRCKYPGAIDGEDGDAYLVKEPLVLKSLSICRLTLGHDGPHDMIGSENGPPPLVVVLGAAAGGSPMQIFGAAPGGPPPSPSSELVAARKRIAELELAVLEAQWTEEDAHYLRRRYDAVVAQNAKLEEALGELRRQIFKRDDAIDERDRIIGAKETELRRLKAGRR